MAKNGVKIDELFLSLGLDLDQLDSDLVGADKTVAEGISSIKAKMARNKVKMEIDQSSFDGATTSAAALDNKTQHLTNQLNLQKQSVAMLGAVYQQASKDENISQAAKNRLLDQLLREQKAEAQLASQIRMTNAARNSAGGDSGSSLSGVVTSLQGKFYGIMGVVTSIIGLVAGGFGLKLATADTVEAGENVFKLSEKLHMSQADAASLSRTLKLTDTDTKVFSGTMVRLDRSVESAGHSGNAITNSLKEFGVSLTDANGKLLPYNTQLSRLAAGYKDAAKAGMEEEFVAQVLGARGQAMIPLLEQYTEVAEAAARVKVIPINPADAHEASQNFKMLSMETDQFGRALGNALIPLVNEYLPRFTKLLANVVDWMDRLSKKGEEAKNNWIVKLGETLSVLGGLKGWTNLLPDAKRSPDEDAWRNIKGDTGSLDTAKFRTKLSEETKKAQEELDAALYKSTHTRIENEIFDIDQKLKKSKEAGVDEVVATAQAEQAKAEIIKKYDKEIEESHIALQDALLKSTEHGLEARLGEIEREKDAWVKKAHDEVLATEWAEAEKIKAVKGAVRARYGEEIRAVETAIKAGQDPLAAYNKAHDAVMKNLEYDTKAFDFVKERVGVRLPGDEISRVQVDGNKISSISEVVKELQYNAQLLEKAGLNSVNKGSPISIGSITVSVPIHNMNGEADIPVIADKAANLITQKIEAKLGDLGGVENSY